jgi:hypothetical protein
MLTLHVKVPKTSPRLDPWEVLRAVIGQTLKSDTGKTHVVWISEETGKVRTRWIGGPSGDMNGHVSAKVVSEVASGHSIKFDLKLKKGQG